ncbi:MAG: ATP-dependent metallopeptidase FtsH/Yme1/Tma family protein, partial [Gammaproteobacteria bacterium]|nr:ATP-dependent metallopeptidase FtsH/Yme1/Tma family protein [Gammaproteobacteria bacterium]
MNDLLKNILLWVVIAVILMSVFNNLSSQRSAANTLSYTDFITRVKSGEVQNVVIDGREIEGRLAGGDSFTTFSPETDNKALVGDLLDAGVQIRAVPTE